MRQKTKRLVGGITMIAVVVAVGAMVLLSPRGEVIPKTEAEYVLAQATQSGPDVSSSTESEAETPPLSSGELYVTTTVDTDPPGPEQTSSAKRDTPSQRPQPPPKPPSRRKTPDKKEDARKSTTSTARPRPPTSSRPVSSQPASSKPPVSSRPPPVKSVWDKPFDLPGIRDELLAYGRNLGLKYNPNLKTSKTKNITAKISSGSDGFRNSCRVAVKKEYDQYRDFGGFNVVVEGTGQSCTVYILRG